MSADGKDIAVFDLVGTLADSSRTVHLAVSRALAEKGLPSVGLETVCAGMGGGSRKLLKRVLAKIDIDPGSVELELIAGRIDALIETLAGEGTVAYPGISEALDRLASASVRLAVCSRRATAATAEELRRLGLAGFFDLVLGGEDLALRKPNPRHLLSIVAALESTPQRTIMIGDRRNDVEMARAAGTSVILTAYGFPDGPPETLLADRVVVSPVELPAAVFDLLSSDGGALNAVGHATNGGQHV
jgi:phosphoglycolate phosphatase